MKRIAQPFKIIALFICAALALSACNPWFDAPQYVKVSLDAVYKGDFSKYEETIGLPAQHAQENYEQGYKSQADVFAKMYSLVDAGGNVLLSDTDRAKIEELYKQLYQDVEYRVSDKAKQVNSDYEVEVAIRPVTVFTTSHSDIQAFVSKYNSDIASGVYNDSTVFPDETLNSIFLQGLLDILTPAAQNPTYGDEQITTVRVTHNAEKNSYYINADDLKKISQTVIAYPS